MLAHQEFLHKIVAKRISNSLRDIQSPSNKHRRRWPWELIQNACDSISSDKTRTAVDVKIYVFDDRVEFHHNGSPFTENQLLSLIFMSSEGKKDEETPSHRLHRTFRPGGHPLLHGIT